MFLVFQEIVAKLSDRCFCRFPAAMLVPTQIGTSMVSPYKSLSIWTKVSLHIIHQKNCCDLNLGRVFAYLPSFFSQILDLIFISIYSEWRDTENQQFNISFQKKKFLPKIPKNHQKIYTKLPNNG